MTKYRGLAGGLKETEGGLEAMALDQGLTLRHAEYFWVIKGSGEWGQGPAFEKPGGWVNSPHFPGIQ